MADFVSDGQISDEGDFPHDTEFEPRPDLEHLVENTRVGEVTPLITAKEVKEMFPITERTVATTLAARKEVVRALVPSPRNKLIVVMAGCSTSDPEEDLAYAEYMLEQQKIFDDQLVLIKRTMVDKPRTIVGWKGYVNDPDRDGSYNMDKGLILSRKLMRDTTQMGVPIAMEVLDNMTPQYFAAFLSWASIGARTTEAQRHREVVAASSYPIGFKNTTDGNIDLAIDSVLAARHPHVFPGVDDLGINSRIPGTGHPECHIILRGGRNGPNYSADSIAIATAKIRAASERHGVHLPPVVMVDCSHGNSGGDFHRQVDVAFDVAEQIENDSTEIMGIMIESNHVEGKQPVDGTVFGMSRTDACIGLADTGKVLDRLASAWEERLRRAA